MQYMLKGNPTTHVLSVNLKEALATSESMLLCTTFQMQLLFYTGLEEEKLYREAMINDRKVSLSYTKILALGHGQVGKSTFLYRLMGLMKGNILTSDSLTQPQCSTGIAEMREACITYTSQTGALTSESWQVFDEHSELQCQLSGFMSLLTEQAPIERREQILRQPVYPKGNFVPSCVSKTQQEQQNVYTYFDLECNVQEQQTIHTTHVKPNDEDNIAYSEPAELHTKPLTSTTPAQKSSSIASYPLPKLSNIDKVLIEFEELRIQCKHSTKKTKFHMLFNIADVGGQPAFLEMLPSLTIGPALYLVFMKLLQGLTTRYPAAFKCKDGRGSKLCRNYTYTSEEVIFTALSSIACFGNSDEEVELYVTKTSDKKQTNSLAVLVGTFRDEIKDKNLMDKIDSELKQKLEKTNFFDKGLLHSTSFLQVNNYSAPKSEIKVHRRLIEDLLEKKFRKYEIPARWLTLSICLKLLAQRERRHEVSFDDCAKLGSRLGMNRGMVKAALQFLHKYIGLVMYFPRNNHLNHVVICDPQVIFSSISELIFDVYDPRNMYVTEAQHNHFVRTGCFSPDDIRVMDTQSSKKGLLSVDTLVQLLVHLNIMAEVPADLGHATVTHSGKALAASNDQEGGNKTIKHKQYYFLPAVLQTAESSLLVREASEANEELLPEPLCIRFQTGYLPLGFVCALCANLIAESNFELIPFMEGHEQILYKNMMRFLFQGKFKIVLISSLEYCEIRVSRCAGTVNFWDNECCPRIKTLICEAADRVIQSLKHGSLYKPLKDITYELAFRCPLHQGAEFGHEPLAKFVYHGDLNTRMNYSCPDEIKCVDPSCLLCTELAPQMQVWFGEVR